MAELKLKNISITYKDRFTKRSQFMEIAKNESKMKLLETEYEVGFELLKILTSILVERVETKDETITDKNRFYDVIFDDMESVDNDDFKMASEALIRVLKEAQDAIETVSEDVKKKDS